MGQQFATFTFDVVGAAGSFSDVITVSDNIFFTGWANQAGAVDIPTNYIDIREDVGQVPVPAAVWLFASGLLGMVGVARRRNRNRVA